MAESYPSIHEILWKLLGLYPDLSWPRSQKPGFPWPRTLTINTYTMAKLQTANSSATYNIYHSAPTTCLRQEPVCHLWIPTECSTPPLYPLSPRFLQEKSPEQPDNNLLFNAKDPNSFAANFLFLFLLQYVQLSLQKKTMSLYESVDRPLTTALNELLHKCAGNIPDREAVLRHTSADESLANLRKALLSVKKPVISHRGTYVHPQPLSVFHPSPKLPHAIYSRVVSDATTAANPRGFQTT